MARSPSLAWRAGLRGAVVGLSAGFLILIFAEIFFHGSGATDLARQMAWVLFGAPFGAVEGFRRQTPLRLLLGVIGGALGGLVGGALTNLGNPFGLTVMGFLIGFFIGLLHDLFKQAWLVVLTGRSEGREVILDRPTTVLGSGDAGQVDFGLYGDPTIMRRHALVDRHPAGYTVAPLPGASIQLNNTAVTGPTSLHNGDRLHLGQTLLQFRNRRE